MVEGYLIIFSIIAYRPIDDAKMTDGLLDYTNHTCPHVLHCPHCDYQQTVMVKEIQT